MSASPIQFWLRADAAVTGANGLAYLAAAPVISGLSGIPTGVQYAAGAFLTAFAVFTAVASVRTTFATVTIVIAINVAWAIVSLAVAILNPFGAGVVGVLWIAAQAIIVGVFAALQWRASRRPALAA